VYGWPLEDAARQAVSAIRAACTRVSEVRMVAFSAVAAEALKDQL